MKVEKSCGAVIFTQSSDDIRYVVIRSHNGDYGFPKGHMEAGEDEVTTALREIREEAGLVPQLLDSFRESISYPLPGKSGTIKQSIYFLAEFSGQKPIPQPEEVAEVYLMTYQQAMDCIAFENLKQILTRANTYLTLA